MNTIKKNLGIILVALGALLAIIATAFPTINLLDQPFNWFISLCLLLVIGGLVAHIFLNKYLPLEDDDEEKTEQVAQQKINPQPQQKTQKKVEEEVTKVVDKETTKIVQKAEKAKEEATKVAEKVDNEATKIVKEVEKDVKKAAEDVKSKTK